MTKIRSYINIYKTCKVGNYFNLKSNTPALLLSNVVYRFSCPCDAGLTYIGKSTRHVITRAKEHLNLGSSVKSKIKDHIIDCNLCNKKDMDSLIHSFSVIKKCSSDYDCKIHEALIIKKHQPKLNKHCMKMARLSCCNSSNFSHVICKIIIFFSFFSLFFSFFLCEF